MTEIENKVINMYTKEYKSLKDIALICSYKSANSVLNILKKYNIKRRSKAGYKEPFYEDFFENINTEEKAYFLGYFIADGNVYEREKSQPCIRIELSNKDIKILKRFETALGIKGNVKNSRKNCSILRIHSKKMFNDLGKYGVIPNKTGHEKFITLEGHLMPHFIRGFFDGDGWVTNTTSHGKRKGSRKCLGFVSNYNFLNDMSMYLNMHLDTKINKISERQGCCMLLYSSKKDVNNIINYLYKDANIYLERKLNSCYQVYTNTEQAIEQVACVTHRE